MAQYCQDELVLGFEAEEEAGMFVCVRVHMRACVRACACRVYLRTVLRCVVELLAHGFRCVAVDNDGSVVYLHSNESQYGAVVAWCSQWVLSV